MDKTGKTNWEITFLLFIFDCFQICLILGHSQEKSFVEKNVLKKFL